MAAPSSTVPPAATGPGPINTDVGFITYLKEALSGTATLLQEVPEAEALEAAGLLQEVPIVGIVCKTFLQLEQFVETAKSNEGELAVLLMVCDVVVKGLLDKRSNRKGLERGFKEIEKCMSTAKAVAKRCNGTSPRDMMRQKKMARRNCKDIESVMNHLKAFCTASNLVIDDDTNVSRVRLDVSSAQC